MENQRSLHDVEAPEACSHSVNSLSATNMQTNVTLYYVFKFMLVKIHLKISHRVFLGWLIWIKHYIVHSVKNKKN